MNELPVLYAEDDQNDIFFMQRAFEDAGIPNPLVAVTDGKAAVEYLSGSGKYTDREKHPLPCLIILDLKMPRMSGLDVLKWIRTQPALIDRPVIILTSSSGNTDIQSAYSQGANSYLVKPGKPGELFAIVRSLKDYWLLHNQVMRDGHQES